MRIQGLHSTGRLFSEWGEFAVVATAYEPPRQLIPGRPYRRPVPAGRNSITPSLYSAFKVHQLPRLHSPHMLHTRPRGRERSQRFVVDKVHARERADDAAATASAVRCAVLL